MLNKARLAIGSFFVPELKSMFNLKNPAPLVKWGADLIGGMDGSEITKPYKQSIWVWRCCQLWLRVAQVPMLLKDKDGNDITTGTLPFLFQNPSSDCSQQELLERMILSLALDGEWFLLKDGGLRETGVPASLQFVPSDKMFLRQGDVLDNGTIVSWSIANGQGGYRRVSAKAVIYDHFTNPYSPHRGIAPIEAAGDSMDSDFFSRRHNKHQMRQHGRLAGIVSFKEDMQEDTLKRFSQMWREQYEGNDNAGKTAFFGNSAEYQQLGLSAKDMDWLNAMDITREEICAAFGLSTIVAGGLKGATFSNYEMAMKAAWEETLMPLGNRITSKLNHALVAPNAKAGTKLEFDFQNSVSVLQEDQKMRVDKYVALCSGGKMTPKQAAAICQIDLGEPNPAHDVVWINASELPADAVLSEPEDMDDQEDEDPDDAVPPSSSRMAPQILSAPDTDERPTSSKCIPSVAAVDGADLLEDDRKHKPSSEIKKALVRSNLRQLKGFERKMERTLKAYFYEQRASVLSRLADAGLPIGKSIDGVKSKAIDEAYIQDLLNEKDWTQELKRRMRPIVSSVAELGARQVVRELQGRFEQVTLDSYVKSQLELMGKINDTTADALKVAASKVLEAAVEGDSADTLMDALKTAMKGVYNNTEARRALIARTETTRAMNGGRYEQMTGMGAPLKQWISIMDGNVRDSHADLDGKVIAVDEEFGFGLRFPGDPTADVSETANCRCSVIPVFDRRDVEDSE